MNEVTKHKIYKVHNTYGNMVNLHVINKCTLFLTPSYISFRRVSKLKISLTKNFSKGVNEVNKLGKIFFLPHITLIQAILINLVSLE